MKKAERRVGSIYQETEANFAKIFPSIRVLHYWFVFGWCTFSFLKVCTPDFQLNDKVFLHKRAISLLFLHKNGFALPSFRANKVVWKLPPALVCLIALFDTFSYSIRARGPLGGVRKL